MRTHVLKALSGEFPERIPCKETLNHPGIINYVSGVDVFETHLKGFERAWRKLGIDIHVAPKGCYNADHYDRYASGISVPSNIISRPKVPGGTWIEGNTLFADLGVFPTSMPIEHMPELDKSDEDWIYQYNPEVDDREMDIRIDRIRSINHAFREFFGDLAVQYHLYYTTLFMWPVMKFGWEPFMLAAMIDPQRFDEHFWQPWSRISLKYVTALSELDEEVIFTHDDLAMSTGLVFPPDFYEKYIFPRYTMIWEPLKKAGKKLVFVIDGNIDCILERLLEFPIDGIMFENPATPFERVLATWGEAGRGFIGGISTAILTGGSPEEVCKHTRKVIEQGRNYPGFMISSCGGLHGDIPMENMLAYFRTRNEMGIPADLD